MAVPAVTSSKVKHARQREAALGKGRVRPVEAAVVVVVVVAAVMVVLPRAGSGQR